MINTKIKYIIVVAVLISLIAVPAISQTNTVAVNATGNNTPWNSNAVFNEPGNNANIIISTGTGNTAVFVTLDTRINATNANLIARIKEDGNEIARYNITSSIYEETTSFVVNQTETAGTHKYALEVFSTAGRQATIYRWAMSVQYLQTGEFAPTPISGQNISGTVINENITSNTTILLPRNVIPFIKGNGVFTNVAPNTINKSTDNNWTTFAGEYNYAGDGTANNGVGLLYDYGAPISANITIKIGWHATGSNSGTVNVEQSVDNITFTTLSQSVPNPGGAEVFINQSVNLSARWLRVDIDSATTAGITTFLKNI